MESQKIYLAGGGESAGNSGLTSMLASALQNKGIDPNLLLAMGGNGFGGWGNGGFMELLFFFIILGCWGGNGNGFGWGGNGGNNGVNSAILSEIQRNGLDINTLATNLNCSVGQVQAGINALGTQICNLSAQNGQSALQIINAIQAGNQTLASQLAQCCCDNKLLITQQGYENQLAIANQTNVLGGKIDAQTAMIKDNFCAVEMRDMQNKLDATREELSTYKTSAMTSQIVGSAVAPINATIAAIKSDIDGIKCRLPETFPVPAQRGVYLDPCLAAQFGLYGGLPGAAGASFWG